MILIFLFIRNAQFQVEALDVPDNALDRAYFLYLVPTKRSYFIIETSFFLLRKSINHSNNIVEVI